MDGRHRKKRGNKHSGTFRPFRELKGILERHHVKLPREPLEKPNVQQVRLPKNADRKDETNLFLEAMEDVTPLPKSRRFWKKTRHRSSSCFPVVSETDAEVVELLTRLIETGEGFIVSQTPEYMEGSDSGIPRKILNKLHSGDYSIQGHIDLHGYGVAAAREAFYQFMRESIMERRSAVLIIHGRGLSSPGEPVLKSRVREWLTTGIYKKSVIAFTSARSCDGGAGATYVLLRPGYSK